MTVMGEGQALFSGSLVMQLLTQREERLLTWGGQASKELDPPPFSQETEAMGAGHPSNDRCVLPSPHIPGLGCTRGTRDIAHRQDQSTGQWLLLRFTLPTPTMVLPPTTQPACGLSASVKPSDCVCNTLSAGEAPGAS